MYHLVNSCDLKFHNSDQSCPTRGFKVPYEEPCAQHWSAADIDGAYVGIRCHFETQRRVQISVRSRRPSPNGVFHQLTIWLLVQHTTTDMSARLCIEQPYGYGIEYFSAPNSLVRPFAAQAVVARAFGSVSWRGGEAGSRFRQGRQSCQVRRTMTVVHESSVLLLWRSATIDNRFGLLLELSRELAQLFERITNGRQGTP